ncbi:glycosyltransferase [Enterorhabdus mucosicola]|uniref:Glycosyltransferase n=1 Tax=Adlercreutzia mucosicola TaxID=580026 RepID=A0A6N8JNA3_9ACTN|nr:glycosyltransferase family 2 protein [Adlercreutzia mucosicola]MVX61062.1 glycosyltransferase [Adlercreutzia mucosicola]
METSSSPRASVIIPAFNASDHILESVTSGLRQTEAHIEIICIDDGSTDNTTELLAHLAATDARVKVLQQKNGGGGRARNNALEIAQGEYLFFLDADDLFDTNMVERMTSALDESKADMAVCRARTLNDITGLENPADWVFRRARIPQQQPFNWRDMPHGIFNTFANVPWNKAFRRSFVESHHLRFQELRRTNDCLFVCSALILAQSIVSVDEELVTYRVGGSTNCQATNDTSSLDFLAAFIALKAFLQQQGLLAQIERSFTNHALDAVMYNLHTLKSYGAFSEVYDKLPAIESEFHFLDHPDDFYYDQEQWFDYKALRSLSQSEWLFNLGRHRHNDIVRLDNDLSVTHRDFAIVQAKYRRTPLQLAKRAFRRIARSS